MLGQALSLFLNKWGRRDVPFHSETLGGGWGRMGEVLSLPSTLASDAALSREAKSSRLNARVRRACSSRALFAK